MTFDPMESSMDQEAVTDIVDAAIENNDVVLFMKGSEQMPQCGFSQRAVDLVTRYRQDVHTVDALQSLDEFRVALEDHSDWETIPQAYVDGEFVGGSDVLGELEERGDLAETLNAEDANAAESTDDAADSTDDDGVQSPF